jgi:hypothetical protein
LEKETAQRSKDMRGISALSFPSFTEYSEVFQDYEHRESDHRNFDWIVAPLIHKVSKKNWSRINKPEEGGNQEQDGVCHCKELLYQMYC